MDIARGILHVAQIDSLTTPRVILSFSLSLFLSLSIYQPLSKTIAKWNNQVLFQQLIIALQYSSFVSNSNACDIYEMVIAMFIQ